MAAAIVAWRPLLSRSSDASLSNSRLSFSELSGGRLSSNRPSSNRVGCGQQSTDDLDFGRLSSSTLSSSRLSFSKLSGGCLSATQSSGPAGAARAAATAAALGGSGCRGEGAQQTNQANSSSWSFGVHVWLTVASHAVGNGPHTPSHSLFARVASPFSCAVFRRAASLGAKLAASNCGCGVN